MESIAVFLVFVIVVVGGFYWLLCWYERRQKNTWTIAAEGIYDHSEVRSAMIAARRLSKFGIMVVTTIFFREGHTRAINGVIISPPVPGTKIRVLKNGFAEFRIEILSTPAA